MLNETQKQFIIENYPNKGKHYCCDALGLKESQVRTFCADNKIRINRDGEHFKDFQERAAKSKVGKKRPIHSEIMKQKAKDGLIPQFTAHTEESKLAQSIRMKKYIKENGHPKGMLGKNHTEVNKKITGEASIKMWKNPNSKVNSKEHRQLLSDNSSRNMNIRMKENPNSVNSRSKKGSIEIGGKKLFARSTWEANIAAYLEFLKSKGEIKDWEHEPITFWFLSIKRGVRSYKPDFRITNNDDTIYYEEVKGWMDDKSKTKLNRMRIYYPLIEVRVLGEKRYKEIAKNKALFPNWGLLD